jgi:hypothetical protein
MKLKIDFYKTTGKWYTGVEICTGPLVVGRADRDLLYRLCPITHPEDYIMVARSASENEFYERVFLPTHYEFATQTIVDLQRRITDLTADLEAEKARK